MLRLFNPWRFKYSSVTLPLQRYCSSSTTKKSLTKAATLDTTMSNNQVDDKDEVFGMKGDTLRRYRNMGATVLDDGITTITPVRGLGSQAFNFGDGIYPSNLLAIFGTAKLSAMCHKDSVIGRLARGYLTFEVVMDLKLHRSIYEKCTENWYLWNLQVVGQMLHCGRSSYTYQMTLQDKDNQDVLATFTDKAALVSPATRRIARVPQELAGCGIEHDMTEKTICSYKIPDEIPLNACTYNYTILYSDADPQGHTSSLTYIKLFQDFATTACYQGAFKGLGKYLREYQVSRIISHYAKESMFTDQIHVHVWQDTSYHMLLHCAISRNSEYIYYGDMMFCESESTSPVKAQSKY